MSRLSILLGAGNAAIAIVLAAFATHMLPDSWPENRYITFQTATDYHLYHALSLIVVGILLNQRTDSKFLKIAAAAMLIGLVLFCGSLYLLSLTDLSWLGSITPIGGIILIGSWILMMAAYTKRTR